MFGTGRRSLDDDDKVEAAAPVSASASAPAAVQTAVDSDTDEDATFAGTRSDWRRQKEVDFAAVPSFSAELVDAPTEARAESSIAHEVSPLVEARAESTVVENPFATLSEAEAKVEAVVEANAPQTFALSPAVEPINVEPVTEAPRESAIEIAQTEVQVAVEPHAVADVTALNPPVVETAPPEPLAAAPVQAPPPVEPVVEAQVETPVAHVVPPAAQVEPPPATESGPTLAAVVETVTSPRKWLDFLMPSRAARSSEPAAESPASAVEPPAPIASEASQATVVADVPIAEVQKPLEAPAPEVAVSEVVTAAESLESSPAVAESAPASAATEEPSSTQEAHVERAVEESGQHWSEIASQLAAEAPLVEAALNADRASVTEPPGPAFAAADNLHVATPATEAPATPVSAVPESTAAGRRGAIRGLPRRRRRARRELLASSTRPRKRR